MSKHPRAGTPATKADLINIPALMAAYYVNEPNPGKEAEQVSFGTSGHRGSALKHSFNEAHILAISQAIVAYREEHGITGPLMLGKDTHALSEAAFITALEVFIANGIEVHIQADLGYTPTPVISHAILTYNQGRSSGLADGVVITPSHNPPQDGGFKYNPPHGGPADSDVTKVIEKYANAILSSDLIGVNVVSFAQAEKSKRVKKIDWISSYVSSLDQVIDMAAIQQANLRVGVDAMGGAGAAYWRAIKEQFHLDLTLFNDHADPSFSFMALDKDGAIRMDCSSADAMASLLALKDKFDLGLGNDPDYDRHGIVTPDGLMNPNHYLAVAIDYLCKHRDWSADKVIGKTLVSSAIIDRVVAGAGRQLLEVPVGFKWFAEGLAAGSLAFAGEESAGASFLDRQGKAWSTDKDGLILCLLALEIQAVTGKSPSEYYRELEAQYGQSSYARIDCRATSEEMAAFADLEANPPTLDSLAGEPVTAVLNRAPGNQAGFGGIKVTTENGWFAVRPSGTEPVYKIYAESLRGPEHLAAIQAQAQQLLSGWLKA
ncbi:phosphoglucomutase (alpha-D-glucose-1,6-bisphosphate-dependent) [Aliidiomarina haloalkalitolerans]|uniref:Phosphoglucomutase n=1 Tax=Aliidiomarina haloalkalitolerans TaxID=859059 RepID=A0A432VZ13_9GAMM|nr:phosphoglucomutase (alpha-D-glucose-1,6-bisphosphate-dependent) [Aliidiomarina haloalkalitolerans]RUO21888.1 phosphoglucomutase, alpha-D-glucose phosphate-specific [Aliidiomarina haloalkalitolerans]